MNAFGPAPTLYDVWTPVESYDDLPDVPSINEFEYMNHVIDVGYTMFDDDAYVYGPYALLHDEEEYGNDLWGWSSQVRIQNRCDLISHKCGSKEEAWRELVRWRNGL